MKLVGNLYSSKEMREIYSDFENDIFYLIEDKVEMPHGDFTGCLYAIAQKLVNNVLELNNK